MTAEAVGGAESDGGNPKPVPAGIATVISASVI